MGAGSTQGKQVGGTQGQVGTSANPGYQGIQVGVDATQEIQVQLRVYS